MTKWQFAASVALGWIIYQMGRGYLNQALGPTING